MIFLGLVKLEFWLKDGQKICQRGGGGFLNICTFVSCKQGKIQVSLEAKWVDQTQAVDGRWGRGVNFLTLIYLGNLSLGGGEFKHNLRLSFLKITQKSRKGMNLVIVPYHFARGA